MAIFSRLLICLLAVSIPAQTWAAPMLCHSDEATETAEIDNQDHGSHAHHMETNEGSSASADTDVECASDCECIDCVTTVALNCDEFTTDISYRTERTAQRYQHAGPFLDKLFRPPIHR
ncbi:MAG: hypothetical protein ACR2QQ_06500 [Gammaproteobacteria bacterium]